jgi:hypothetical protein
MIRMITNGRLEELHDPHDHQIEAEELLFEEPVAEDLARPAAVDAIETLVARRVDLLHAMADEGMVETLMSILDDPWILFNQVVVLTERATP